MNKIRYFWKGEFYYIDLYKDNLANKFSEYEKRNKTSSFQFCSNIEDKNGIEIYEGDIVKTNRGILGITNNICEFWAFGRPLNYSMLTNIDIIKTQWEIIGNIHKNPELLNTSSNTDYKKLGE